MTVGFETDYLVSASVNYSVHLKTVGNKRYNVDAGITKFTVVSHDDFMEPGEVNDMSKIKEDLDKVVDFFKDSMIFEHDDPALWQFLQPKSGYSVQEWLTYIREQMEKEEWGAHPYYRGFLIGRETPPSTYNSLKIFVTKNEPTLEFMAAFVLSVLSRLFNIDAVRAERGDYAVELSHSNMPTLL